MLRVCLLESPHPSDSNEFTQHTIILQNTEKASLNYTYLTPVIRKHAYSNILKILQPKMENFLIKKNLIFFVFLLKT